MRGVGGYDAASSCLERAMHSMRRRLVPVLLAGACLLGQGLADAGDYDPRADPWITPEQRAVYMAQREQEAERIRQLEAAEQARLAQMQAAEQARLDLLHAQEMERLRVEQLRIEEAQRAAFAREEAAAREQAQREQEVHREMETEAARRAEQQAMRDAAARVERERLRRDPANVITGDAARARMVREEAARARAASRGPEEPSPYDSPLPTDPTGGPGSYDPALASRSRQYGIEDRGTLPPSFRRSLRRRSATRLDVDVLYTWRDDPSGRVGIAGTPAGTTDFSWGDVSFDGAIGGGLHAHMRRNEHSSFSFHAYYFGGFDDRRDVTGAFTFNTSPPGAPATTGAQTARLESDSEVFSIGVAWRPAISQSATSRFDWIVGLEANRISDQIALTSLTPGFALGTPASLREELSSWLIGVSGGVGFDGTISGDLGFDAAARVFLGVGLHDVRAEQTHVFASGTHANERSDTSFAWGIDLNLGLRYAFTATMGARLGYRLLYRGDTPRVGEGMDLGAVRAGAPGVAVGGGGLLVHGFYGGLSFDL